MNGFERRREQKKKRILEAARDLVFSQGAQKTSVREVAEKAGVSPVSIYNFFGSKENLVRQVYFAYMDEAMAKLLDLVESDLPVREKLELVYRMSEQLSGEFNEAAYASFPWMTLSFGNSGTSTR